MLILGVTGSIGSGKSFVCKCFKRLPHVRIISSDDEVHQILRTHHIIKKIAEFAPSAIEQGKINRVLLGNIVFNQPELRQKLESIIHPEIALRRNRFIKQAVKDRKTKVLILDIPLLFERNLEVECDLILTVYCRKFLQKSRVLRRNKMTEEKFNAIDKLQLPPHEKIRNSDFAINSGLEKSATMRKVKEVYSKLISGKLT